MLGRGWAAAAAAGLVVLFAAQAAAADTVSLTFLVNVTSFQADGDLTEPFVPFSFFQTWTLSQGGLATVEDTPITTEMKALQLGTPTYTAGFENGIGVFRDPTTSFLLEEHASGGSPEYGMSLTLNTLDPRIPQPPLGPDFAAYLASAGPFAFDLVGPLAGHRSIGVNRETDPGFVEAQLFGTATLVGVPEPAAWTLMIAGFGAAGAALRRRRALA